MNIYVSHTSSFDYKTELYLPIMNSPLAKEHNFIYPHEHDPKSIFNSKGLFESGKCSLVLAEVSFQSTGHGIELGWASIHEIPVVCIYKNGYKISNSLKAITKEIIEYNSSEDMIMKLDLCFKRMTKLNKEIKI